VSDRRPRFARGSFLDRALRLAAWGCVGALRVLALLPGEEMVRTGLDNRVEHFIAYAGTMLVAGLAYEHWTGLGRVALALVAYAALLELAQNFSPGRHPNLIDFLASSCGVAASFLALWAWRAWRRRRV
jgi:hypothetical protein